MQRNARRVGGSCLVGAHEGVSRLGGSCGGEPEAEPDRLGRLRFQCARSAAPQGTVAGQHDWSQSMAHAAMEAAAGVLSKEERLLLLRLLKKPGKGREVES